MLRPLVEADYPAVQALHRAVGWPERSIEGWLWLHANPARPDTAAPAGWVIEDSAGVIGGHLGNLVQRFHLGERILYGATGFSIIINRSVRGQGQALLRSFNQQADMFALWTFNANPVSRPMYRRHGLIPWPESTAALKLGWPIDRLALIAGRGLRAAYRHAPDQVVALGERLLNDRVWRSDPPALPAGVFPLTDLGEESPYAVFWRALSAEGRMLSDRSPAMMRWRIRDPDLTVPPVILAIREGDVIVGVAMALVAKGNAIDPLVMEIIDLEALDGHAGAIPSLMTALMRVARHRGVAKTRLQVVSPRLLSRLGSFARTARREGGWGHCHVRFMDRSTIDRWSPTPWDGDYSVCLRPVPLRRDLGPRGASVIRPIASG